MIAVGVHAWNARQDEPKGKGTPARRAPLNAMIGVVRTTKNADSGGPNKAGLWPCRLREMRL